VDPVWSILEFNRVLEHGGHLVISTPNAAAISRVVAILNGRNPASENVLKPMSIYQRHNREYTLWEVSDLLRCCGFSAKCFSTSSLLLEKDELELVSALRQRRDVRYDIDVFGPELFVVAEKVAEKTLASNLTLDERWPTWLYSPHANYRRRPKVFPIVVSDDY
jgi:hypothetical protein